jgi:hypothetical protein
MISNWEESDEDEIARQYDLYMSNLPSFEISEEDEIRHLHFYNWVLEREYLEEDSSPEDLRNLAVKHFPRFVVKEFKESSIVNTLLDYKKLNIFVRKLTISFLDSNIFQSRSNDITQNDANDFHYFLEQIYSEEIPFESRDYDICNTIKLEYLDDNYEYLEMLIELSYELLTIASIGRSPNNGPEEA